MAPDGRLRSYVNLPNPYLGLLISSGKATIGELQTVLSVEDAYDLLEILAIDNHNQRILNADHH